MVAFISLLCVIIPQENTFESLWIKFASQVVMNMNKGNIPKDFWRKRINALKI